ncbi:MAG: SEC-C metal-binding domain-containing protein, partial [Polyangiaceae bacterium]
SHKYQTINEVIPRLRKDEHYVVDEKAHSVTLTDEGVEQAQRLMGIKNLFDPANLESLHIMQQCLRAHALYKRDVNYLVADDGKVLIIDEFTGRVLPGRRWSDGLHQAVEAKENVRIQEETRTMATITFQNLFRLYNKLSGMTGTADTEADEFQTTYKLGVIQIPTNRIIARIDHNDLVYKTEREKFTAVVNELEDYHERGQPVLVGTTSVEKSTAIAKILKKKGIPHAVLNAKQHEKEAFVVAQAGRKGAITVSTNMAGRGTDIILGGNAEMLARLEFKELGKDPDVDTEEFEKIVTKHEAACKAEGQEVKDVGGLHILGTERHESRRIDNQLRGRAGRQGDPGSSRFYLSLEDDLMRIFAGDKVKSLMDRMGMPDDEPIEHPWVSKSIGDAQEKVEGHHFDVRKNLLEYDDVMSEQRKTVYKIRQQLLLGRYTPEILDDSGKPTGELREIKPLQSIVDEVKPQIEQIILHYGTHLPKAGEGPVAKPETVADVKELYAIEQMRVDVYQYWGYRFDYKESDAKKPQKIYDRLLAEIPQSLTEQRERLLDLADGIVSAIVEESCPPHVAPEDWKWDDIAEGFRDCFAVKPVDFDQVMDPADLAHVLYKQALAAIEAKEKAVGIEPFLRVFRHVYLEEIDREWVEHLTNMEHLRDGIGLRGYGQLDPKQEYKKEGYDIFVNMVAAVNTNVATKLMKVQVRSENDIARMEQQDAARHEAQQAAMQLRHGSDVEGSEDPAAGTSNRPPARRPVPQAARPVQQPAQRPGPKIGRNDPCPCGSGEKFKKCHGAVLEEEGAADADDASA